MRILIASFLTACAIMACNSAVFGQKTIVTGKVYDPTSGEALPFVNVFFKDSKIGTTSDESGNYRIETYYPTDSLIASMVGYSRTGMKVKKDRAQVLDFEMAVSGIALGTVNVVGDRKKKDPAVEIMKRVVRNKKANNREKLLAYEYDLYNKIEFDMNNVGESFRKRKVMKPFEFIFDNVDSTSEEKPFIPIFLTESFSRYYYNKNPKHSKEIIEATKVAGVKNESVSQFLGDMYQSTNIYHNYVSAFGKSFVSPLSDFGPLSYKYFLLDSAILDQKYKCFKIAFLPRRKGELTFEGEMWVHDTTFAIKEIEATIGADANINWINGFTVKHTYDQAEDEVWMLTKEHVVVDFNVSEKTIGFYGRKTSIYSDFKINETLNKSFFTAFNNVEVKEDANDKSDEFWSEKRPEQLSVNEANVYDMVDTIQNIPAFRTYVDIVTLFVTGYYEMKYFDLGQYYTFFSFNQIEGLRGRFGGKTNSDFSTKVELKGYIAYGLKDEQVKYEGATRLFLTKKPRQVLGLIHKRDLEQLGQSANAWQTDNILSSVFRRTPNNQLNAFEEYKVNYQVEYFPGLSNTLTFNRRDIWSVGSFPFQKISSEGLVTEINRIKTSEVTVGTRIAYDEKFISGNLDRVSLGTRFPVVNASVSFGIKDFLDGNYNYQRININIQDRVAFNPLGQSDITIDAGKVWGDLPFPLLHLFNGNETYFYDIYAFNLMNYYEFVADEWVNVFWVHHFNGLLFNKVPLIRKLKWREVATFRGAVGGLSDDHLTELQFPTDLFKLTKPYFEAGVGVENILKIFRVDALWRLSYLNNPDVVPFGIRTTFQFDF
ncbi:MAG: carboxypeptidase-like regulatory domain-containing protein [Flavobacteriales bacterium]|nr:carboxypeptidase-like regulatory domain-containing protein [Flavobacteriales bacterium]MBT4931572.1 carboxypeptidase-like regulatory domain-containing protein [Flavobacteriales bacterium]MBT5133799.1 carboxypeptidase-like regulatory domain-containing protein [Flavobacteriales bacterium]MBT5976945.1 carboxypeptidase-like regulatory domain-containing protein [Flavobacteriales bacterium]MBT6132403.1 carboxypeptidase-like regulatory domain-containing protein [Flavobacteriales bacterium]